VDFQVVIPSVGAAATGLGVTIRSVLRYLDQRADRTFARYLFDQTRSTSELGTYIKLREAQRPGPLLELKGKDVRVEAVEDQQAAP